MFKLKKLSIIISGLNIEPTKKGIDARHNNSKKIAVIFNNIIK